MLHIVPDYYREFRCIGGSCAHNCCIGWEIDIDEAAAAYYAAVPGELGRRLQSGIDRSGEVPHFILGAGERCPFLNDCNLCDIHAQLGEDKLCTICAEHPRFHNELPGRTESGVGLCCEAAAELILSRRTPVKTVRLDEEPAAPVACSLPPEGSVPPAEDAVIALRDEAIALLQDRRLTLPQRLEAMRHRCAAALPAVSFAQWADFLQPLERLDPVWDETLALLRAPLTPAQLQAFDAHMTDRQHEYEQFAVYLVWRHFANAPDEEEAAVRAAFAALGCMLLHRMGAALFARNGDFTFAQQIELARQFSSELEYCEDNLYAVWDELYTALA